MRALRLSLVPGRFAVCRLEAHEPIPAALATAPWTSIMRTASELSIVCAEELAPQSARCETGWRCLAVEGTLAFSETGILAALAAPLADAGVPLFALSTFDTDHLLVPAVRLGEAVAALRKAGYDVAE